MKPERIPCTVAGVRGATVPNQLPETLDYGTLCLLV